MNPILRNIFAIIVGLVIGNLINMGIIILGAQFIAPPKGVDVNDIESIKANIHLYSFKDFIIPFLAHALGTLTGAFTCTKIAVSNKLTFALMIGFIFLIAGVYMVFSLPSPMWFNVTDLVLAYIPMAFLGWKMAK